MSVLRFLLILMGAFRKEVHGIINLDRVPASEYADYPFFDYDKALRSAQEDAQRALRAEERGSWKLARLWWCRAASRHLINSDESILYLMLAEKAATKAKPLDDLLPLERQQPMDSTRRRCYSANSQGDAGVLRDPSKTSRVL